MTAYVDALRAHVATFFAGHPVSRRTFDEGPIVHALPGFCTLAIEPGPTSNLWTYVSAGAALAEARQQLEFVLVAPADDEVHAEYLAMAAYYHLTTGLGLEHTVPIGRPWLPGSSLDHLLVSLPYPFGPSLEHFVFEGATVRLLWLLPITARERAFKVAHGSSSLEEKFDEAELDYGNPRRRSVV